MRHLYPREQVPKISTNVPQTGQEKEERSSIERSEIINEFNRAISAYNSGNNDTFWAIFSNFAKSKMNKEKDLKSLSALRDTFGTITDGTYLYKENAGNQGTLLFTKTFFTVDLEGSAFGEKALLTLTLSSDGNEHEILGFHLGSE